MKYFNKNTQNYEAYQPELLELRSQGFEVKQTLLQKSSIQKKTLTTKQLQGLGVCDRVIRACPIQNVIPWNNCLIWHQGRNIWKIYEEKKVN